MSGVCIEPSESSRSVNSAAANAHSERAPILPPHTSHSALPRRPPRHALAPLHSPTGFHSATTRGLIEVKSTGFALPACLAAIVGVLTLAAPADPHPRAGARLGLGAPLRQADRPLRRPRSAGQLLFVGPAHGERRALRRQRQHGGRAHLAARHHAHRDQPAQRPHGHRAHQRPRALGDRLSPAARGSISRAAPPAGSACTARNMCAWGKLG